MSGFDPTALGADLFAERGSLLETILRQAADGIVVCDADGELILVNEAARRMARRDPEGESLEIGPDAWGVAYDADGEPIPLDEWSLAKALRGERTVARHVRMVRSSGEEYEILISAAPVRDEEGGIVGGVATFTDISERVRVEEIERERQLERRLAAVVDRSDDAILTNALDGTITTWNAGAEGMYGWTAAEAVGRSIRMIIPTHRGQEYDMILGRIAAGERVERLETERRTKDGEILRVSLSVSPLHDRQGRVIGASAIAHDVTEQRRIVRKLEAAEERYRTTLESLVEGFQIVDRSWRYVFVNDAAARHGRVEKDDLLGNRMQDCYPGIEETPLFDRLEECMDLRVSARFENRFEYPDGSHGWFELAIDPVPQGISIVSLDIDERKRAEEEFRELNQELASRVAERTAELELVNAELQAFSYSVAHDLRAPLRSMAGFSQILEEDYGDALDGAGRDVLERIRSGSRRMGRMIDDLLTLSRITQEEIDSTDVDLGQVAREILDELRLADAEDRRVTVEIDDGMVVQGDRRLLRIALYNLLDNAWKYTADEEEVVIEFSAEREGQRTFYCVRDNGVGFDPEYGDRLFVAFQRLHTRERFEGTGIGLATVQRIVQRHGGEVLAEGAPGEGACFRFTIGDQLQPKGRR